MCTNAKLYNLENIVFFMFMDEYFNGYFFLVSMCSFNAGFKGSHGRCRPE
jgi:hypothetical protein